MRCSRGWVDPSLHRSERSAIIAANNHVVGVRAAAVAEQREQAELSKSAQQRQVERRRRRIVVVVLFFCLAVVIAVVAINASTHSSYSDGYQWGESNTIGIIAKTAPSCLRSEMASSGEISDSNFVFNKPEGDDMPTDDYAQWRAGCEAGAKATIEQFNGG
jgi:hypothetical protein